MADDDLEVLLAGHGDDAVAALAELLGACQDLHEARLARGLSILDVAERTGCDVETIEWVDEGDVAAPLEGLAYYAVAVGARLEVRLTRP